MTDRRPGVPAARIRVVPVPPGGSPADLLPGRAVNAADVFTAAEAQLCARRGDLTGWAGRLAAKLAVAELVLPGAHLQQASDGMPGTEILQAIEVLPDASACPDPGCGRSHPPAVRLSGSPAAALHGDGTVVVSISHTSRLAVAVAVVTASTHPTMHSDEMISEGAPP